MEIWVPIMFLFLLTTVWAGDHTDTAVFSRGTVITKECTKFVDDHQGKDLEF